MSLTQLDKYSETCLIIDFLENQGVGLDRADCMVKRMEKRGLGIIKVGIETNYFGVGLDWLNGILNLFTYIPQENQKFVLCVHYSNASYH